MPEVIDHLAELTGFRDRDVVDVTLVGAFRDLLQPECVAIYRPVGEGGGQRWLTRARQRAIDSAASADSIWTNMDDLPALAALPLHQRCLQQQAAVKAEDDGQALSLFPLATERDAGGVLELRTREPLTPEQTRLVSSMLRVYRNFQGLLDYSERDTLTGLLNRTTFDGSFLRLAVPGAPALVADPAAAAADDGDARRAAGPEGAWLGVVDIDHFKSVNDTHGHLIGDEVLLLIARLMRSSFRFHDLLYRFGGEEFVVLMRGGNAVQAVAAFERLRTNVASYAFPRVGRITVSVGFTALRAGDSPAAAFERADRAVYVAKQSGRNQVAHHAELIARGVLVDQARTGDMELF
ncbi:MAG: GGDEF domain-containing protein [Proteobacteria bacterium]|nr:GGDEF domain-containing protein [Pseudomonadota bacterium]